MKRLGLFLLHFELPITGFCLLVWLVGVALSPHLLQKRALARTQAAAPRKETLEARTLRLLPDYKHWTRANKQPHYISTWLDGACMAPSPAMVAEDAKNPHGHKYVVAYVNDIGRKALTEQLIPHYPVGSVVVKSKLVQLKSSTPELCTVMLKREAGYNPLGGDWEYFVTDGAGTQVKASGKIEGCMQCHATRKEADYIFRSYLPDIAARSWTKLHSKDSRDLKAWQRRHRNEYHH